MTATGFDAWPFTVAHFIVMGVFAALVIAGILWGMKLKRRRVRAAEEFDAHREAADAPTAPEDSEGETPAVDTPTPAPPPAADPSPATPNPPASEPASAPPPAGDITMLKGLGPKLAATLAGLGITRVDQIAAMSPAELDALDAQLGTFRGRPARDRWAEQARLLTSGDRAAYEAAFGKLGG